MTAALSRRAFLAPFFAALASPAADPTSAAVRLCNELVVSDIFEAATEQEGKRAAIADWTRKASVYGESFSLFRLARHREVECVPSKAGTQFCRAAGHACTLSQTVPEEAKVTRAFPRGSVIRDSLIEAAAKRQ